MKVTLQYPFTEEKVRALRVGDHVTLEGQLFTGRDRLHRVLFEGGKSPAPLKDGALYHCGPVILRRDGAWVPLAAGPTTSIREEPYTPRLIEQHRVRLIIGKGGMGEGTRGACMRHGAAYLHAVGGAAAVLARCIEKVNGVYFLKEFGPAEAMWDLQVKGFEAVVTMDTRGRSLHRRVERASKRALARALAGA